MPVLRNSIVMIAAFWGITQTAVAGDYRPVTCTSTKPYTGPKSPAFDLKPIFERASTQAVKTSFDPATSDALSQALMTAQGSLKGRAVTASIISPERGTWSKTLSTTGAQKPLETSALFFWASAGKSFTAIAIMQLAEEGKLRLDDPISRYVAGVPNGEVITLRHLLTHTSGLFSANEDDGFRKHPGPLSLEANLAILKKHGAMFCPGEQWRYSNSGYQLLGVVLEKLEGRPYAEIIQTRIIDRLSLTSMRALRINDPLSGVIMPVSDTAEPALDPHEPGPAGAIVASAPDMVAFWQAFLGGKLVKPATVAEMASQLYPMFGQPLYYGEGLMVYALPAPSDVAPDLWLGHSGGASGVKAVVAYSAAKNAYVAVAVAGDGSAEATANLLLMTLK